MPDPERARKKERIIAWAGFSDGEIHFFMDDHWKRVAAVYRTRKDARADYEDVRKVEIQEIG